MTATGIEEVRLARDVQSSLGALRGRIRWYVWAEGLAVAAAWLGVAFWATLAVDWVFEPPAAVRGLMLAAAGVVFAAILVQMIVRRAFVRLSDASMATLLERRFPQLDDSLLTAVTLTGRRAEAAECNPRMLRQTCREAEQRIGAVELRRVFNPLPLLRSFATAVMLSATVGAFFLLSPQAFGIWANRSLMLSPDLWPRQTRLEVEGFENGVAKVARGADFALIAKADTQWPVVPKVVQVRYTPKNGARGRATMNRLGAAGQGDPFQRYSYTFRDVLDSYRFDIVGGDARAGEYCIKVVDSPTIEKMMLDREFPAYMDRESRPVRVTGTMQIPLGTGLKIHCRANKELVRVRIDALAGERIVSTTVVGSEDLAANGRSFTHTIESLDEDTTLLFELSDADGITGREPDRLALVTVADQAPRLAVRLQGIGTAITAKARVPAAGTIADDYGIDKVWFETAVDKQPPEEAPVGASPEGAAEFELDAPLEMREFGLVPGQKLLLCVKAADRYDLAGEPNVGTSDRWLLDVVTPEQLRAMLESRELVLRQRFERIIEEVTETRDLLLRIEFASSDTEIEKGEAGAEPGDEPADEEESLSPQQMSAMRGLRVQRALQNSRKNARETRGVSESFEDIRLQLINNRVDTEELNARLQRGIVQPLDRIAAEMFPELTRRIQGLQEQIGDEKLGSAARDRARRQADETLLAMRKVLDRMIELEDFNEVVEMLRAIIKLQDELGNQAQQRKKQKIRELLED